MSQWQIEIQVLSYGRLVICTSVSAVPAVEPPSPLYKAKTEDEL